MQQRVCMEGKENVNRQLRLDGFKLRKLHLYMV
jgi:hypothetical protein